MRDQTLHWHRFATQRLPPPSACQRLTHLVGEQHRRARGGHGEEARVLVSRLELERDPQRGEGVADLLKGIDHSLPEHGVVDLVLVVVAIVGGPDRHLASAQRQRPARSLLCDLDGLLPQGLVLSSSGDATRRKATCVSAAAGAMAKRDERASRQVGARCVPWRAACPGTLRALARAGQPLVLLRRWDAPGG